jgi:16S rRNA (uracil1498-N3)-methyltransferase
LVFAIAKINKFVKTCEFMQIFYSADVEDGRALFSREESGHCLRVLRMRRGDSLTFTDGKGILYEGVISGDDPRAMTVTVTSEKSDPGRRNYRLHVAISPLKNDDRLEWFIEKAVETGIDVITPVICNRSEKKRTRRERLEGIILSAMKQSARCSLPLLEEPENLGSFLLRHDQGKRIIATCDPSFERIAITKAFGRGEDVTILIGPEGDFTPEEVKAAISAGFVPVHMGTGRLRTETAGIAACCSVSLANI